MHIAFLSFRGPRFKQQCLNVICQVLLLKPASAQVLETAFLLAKSDALAVGSAELARSPLAAPAVGNCPPASLAAPSDQLRPLEHDGNQQFDGSRGPFAVIEGQLSMEVLEWLRAGVRELDRSSWSFSPPAEGAQPKDRKFELDRKMEVYGQLVSGDRDRKRTLFAYDASQPHFARWRAWRCAFMQKNVDNFAALESAIRKAIRNVPQTPNKDVFKQPIAEWAGVYGCLQVMNGRIENRSARTYMFS